MAARKNFFHIRKIFRLWALYARMDLLFVTRSLGFALACIFADLLLNLGGITAVFLLAEKFDGIGSWTRPQIVFMLGYASTVTGFTNIFCGFNVLHISRRLGRGQLDHTLIQPQPLWLSLLTEGFVPATGSVPFFAGLSIMVYAFAHMGMPASPAWFLMAIVQFIASITVFWSFSYLVGSLAFWAPRAAEEVCSLTVEMMSSLRSFPLDGVGGFLSLLLISVLPVGFMAWQPCRSLLNPKATWLEMAMTPMAAVVFAALAFCAFKKGFKHYATTGSQRYLGWGHRS